MFDLQEIATLLQTTCNKNVVCTGISALNEAKPETLSFVLDAKSAHLTETSSANAYVSCIPLPENIPHIQVKNARQALAIILGWWQTTKETQQKTSTIAATVVQHSGCVIGNNCTIGENTILYPNVTLYPNTHIGANVIIHAGAVIGADGFGFYQHNGHHKKIPHIGSVYIEDDVEIGANTTIDRGCLGETRIGQGSKIDNLVQIGHNVKIGKHCIIVSQVGITGSTTIGDYTMIGGQAGISPVTIGSKVTIAAKSGVTKNIPDGQSVSGFPAQNHRQALKEQAKLNRLLKRGDL